MPLIVICGRPCCGKTLFSTQLATYLESHSLKVIHINEESESITKSKGYQTSFAEKSTRAAIKSRVTQTLTAECYVIVDALNYIKGYRYELYCIARSLRTSHCVCWIECPSATKAIEWNSFRLKKGQDGYNTSILKDLQIRFESPNSKQRWDNPLFKVYNSVQPALEESSLITTTTTTATTATNPADTMTAPTVATDASSIASSLLSTTQLLPVTKSSWKPKVKNTNKEINSSNSNTTTTTTSISCTNNITATTTSNSNSNSNNNHHISTSESIDPGLDKGADDSVADNNDEILKSLKITTAVTNTGNINNNSNSNNSISSNSNNNSVLTISGSLMHNTNEINEEFLTASSSSFIETFELIKTYFSDAPILPLNVSTIAIPKVSSDLLYLLDSTSQNIMNLILHHQQEQLSESSPVIFKEYNRSLLLYRIVSVQELNRHRRQFVKATASSSSIQSSSSSSSVIAATTIAESTSDNENDNDTNLLTLSSQQQTIGNHSTQHIGVLFIDYLSSQL